MKKDTKMWRQDIPLTTSPLRFFLFASRPYWKFAAISIVLVTVGNIISTASSYIFKLIVNAAVVVQQGGSYSPLLWYSVFYIGALGVAKFLWRFSSFLEGRWSTGAQATARFGLISYVTLHSRAYFTNRFAGSVMNKIRHAAGGMRDVIDAGLWGFLEVGTNAAVSFIITLAISHTIAYIFLGWIAAIVAVNLYMSRLRIPHVMRAHDLETLINGATVDLITNVSTMQEYARRDFEVERLKKQIQERREAAYKSWQYGGLTRTINSALLVIFGGAMVLTTVALARSGLVSVGDIVLVMTIIFRIEGLLQSLGSNFIKFAEVWGEIRESLEEIVEPHEIPDRPGATHIKVPLGVIDINDVSFSYGEHKVFEKLELHIPMYQRVGLVGRSGAGKSTLMRLLLHHHDLQEGSITIDGQDIAHVTQESLRSEIAVVPQEPLLFHRTIAENIAYGNPQATQEDIEHAAGLAQAHDFITRLQDGYQSLVGERGVKLSGGERQRVAIARAILKNAPILLLDEATSSLDSESEVQIQKALAELMKGKTVIAIAHRLSTLRGMDRIIVMDKGTIVEEGTHEELVAESGVYADLWRHQAGGFLQD